MFCKARGLSRMMGQLSSPVLRGERYGDVLSPTQPIRKAG